MYLMRRAYGHFRDWLSSTPDKETVKNLADKYNLIIVTSPKTKPLVFTLTAR